MGKLTPTRATARSGQASGSPSERRTQTLAWEDLVATAGFDYDYPEGEQLPRRFTASIRDQGSDGVCQASLVIDSRVVGDQLRDNSWNDDGYRFHDVFHLANAAVLGWSPCLRRMLRAKRKSDKRVDEIEDGARAIVLEEAVVALVFDYCSANGWRLDAAHVSADLVGTLQRLTAHLECASCPPDLWWQAICDGADAWKRLRQRGSVRMTGDLVLRRLISS
jgi:hypothetical protein